MASTLLIALAVVVVAIVLGAWGITTSDPADASLERDERDISRGRQPGSH